MIKQRGVQEIITGSPDGVKVLLLRLIPQVYERSNHPVGYRPSYLLKYIEALLHKQQGYSPHYIDQQVTCFSIEDIQQQILKWQPLAVIFDVTTLNVETSHVLAQTLNELIDRSRTICVGIGQEVSADVRKFSKQYPQFDIALAGEAELEVVSIIEKFVRGSSIEEIKNYYSSIKLDGRLWTVKELDSLPFLRFDQASLRTYNFVYPLRIAKRLIWGHMITSRGCPHPCMFCSQLMRESYSTKMRYRSAPLVVDEMEHLLEIGANIIAFDDEDFTTSDRHVCAICQEILRRKLKVNWIIHGRVDELSEPLLKLLGKSGCILIRMGMESGNRRILQLLGKTKKIDLWFEQSKNIVRQAQACGMSVAGLFMVGNPTETAKEMRETIEFAKKLGPDIIQVSYFTPFPGTKAYNLYRDKLKGFKTEDFYHYNIPKFNLSNMSDDEFKNAQKLFYRQFLFRPAFFAKHIIKNFLFYLNNHKILLRLLRSVKQI